MARGKKAEAGSDKPAAGKRSTRTIAVIGAVVVAGLAAGLGGVYVMGGFSGNAEAAMCAPAAKLPKYLTPLAVGAVAGVITASEPVYIGDLAFRRADRRPTTLAAEMSGVPNEVALVNLWATWCVPCRQEMPALNRLESMMGQDRFQVIAINVDTRDDGRAQRFMTDNQINELNLNYDPTMGVFNTLKSRGRAVGLPTSLLVTAPGCVVGVMHGPAEWDSNDAKAMIEMALNPPAEDAPAHGAGGEGGGEGEGSGGEGNGSAEVASGSGH